MDADIVALQEVHDLATLDFFHDHYLTDTGLAPYPHRICLPGNDGMGRNLALLSRVAPARVTSHATLLPGALGLPPARGQPLDRPLFCRDCLLAEPSATLSLCILAHLKAPYPDRRRRPWAFRHRPKRLRAPKRLDRAAFSGSPRRSMRIWLVLGDLNEFEPACACLSATGNLPPDAMDFAVDLLETPPAGASAGPTTRPTAGSLFSARRAPCLPLRSPAACPECHPATGPRRHGPQRRRGLSRTRGCYGVGRTRAPTPPTTQPSWSSWKVLETQLPRNYEFERVNC